MNNKNSKKSNNKKNTSKSIKNKNNKKVIKNKECNKYFKTLFMFSSLLNLLLIILSLILIVLYIKNNNKINDLNENINDLKKSIIKKDNEKEPIKEEVIIKNKATKIPVLSYHRTVTSDIRNKYKRRIRNIIDIVEIPYKGYDLIFVARQKIRSVKFNSMKNDVIKIISLIVENYEK